MTECATATLEELEAIFGKPDWDHPAVKEQISRNAEKMALDIDGWFLEESHQNPEPQKHTERM